MIDNKDTNLCLIQIQPPEGKYASLSGGTSMFNLSLACDLPLGLHRSRRLVCQASLDEVGRATLVLTASHNDAVLIRWVSQVDGLIRTTRCACIMRTPIRQVITIEGIVEVSSYLWAHFTKLAGHWIYV